MTGEKVILFGASFLGEKIYNKLKDICTIVAFCDNDSSKEGTLFNGKIVILPKDIRKMEYDKVIIANRYEEDSAKQLEELGVKQYETYRIDINELNKKIQNQQISISEYYDEFAKYVETYDVFGDERLERILKRLDSFISENNKVLDLGCGNGITTEYIARRTAEMVLGIDISSKMIENAKRRDSRAEFICEDITRIQLNETFDRITLFDCLEHIPRESYKQVFHVLKSHLSENGEIIMTLPDPALQQYLRENNPAGLQIIDNEVEIPEIYELCNEYDLVIMSFTRMGRSIYIYNEYVIGHRAKSVNHTW